MRHSILRSAEPPLRSVGALDADIVIIGGGSAGSVLASRLSENPGLVIVLIEAGGEPQGLWFDMPAGVAKLLGNPKNDWCHLTEPDPSINGRRLFWNAGKVLGGSSSMNGMVYMRGQRSDFSLWEAQGCDGWSYADLLPYFLRSQAGEGPFESQFHGSHGPLRVGHQRMQNRLLLDAFFKSAAGNGIAHREDVCDGNVDGAWTTMVTIADGERWHTEKAFLRPARKRPNLHILTRVHADRVIFAGKRAIGVRVNGDDGRPFDVTARREVILSGGATQSPAILMRSGIGDAHHLKTLGIEVIENRSQVGRNLMEHPTTSIRYSSKVPSFNREITNRLRLPPCVISPAARAF